MKRYGGKAVVQDVSLEISSGEIVGLLGPNGAGKTTSFYCIVGLARADRGSICIDDIDFSNAPMHIRTRQGLGYLPQEPSVFRNLSTQDNIRAIAELRKDLSKVQKQELTTKLMEDFDLARIREIKGERLSGGERRRLEIARALASTPRFILLDEPFAGVDPISVEEIKTTVRHLADRNIGVLITDHNVRETLDICHRAYIVAEGHIIAEGDAEAILANETVRRVYLGEQFKL